MEAILRRAVRVTLIVVGVLVVLAVIAPFLISVNQFRPAIEEKASAALGRKVQLGSLRLSFLSGSLSAEDLSIGDDPEFSASPFLTAKGLKVGVEVLPLIFSRTLNVTGVTIDSPQVTLLRTPAGRWNFSSLGGAAARSQGGQTAGAEKLSIKKFDLTNGRIIVGTTSSQKRSVYDHLSLTASDVSMTSSFPVTFSADLPAGGKFTLDGQAGPVDRADAAFTPVSAKLTVSSLNLASTGFLDSSAGLGGIFDLDGTLASQGGEAQTKGTVKLSKALLVAGGSPAGVPVTVDFDTKYDLRRNSGVLNPSMLRIGNAAAHLNGTYEAGGEATTVDLRLHAKDMAAKDLESFLPALGINVPRGASLQGGTLNADLKISGPTSRLVTTGNVGMFGAKLAGFDLGSKLSAVAALAGVNTGKDLDIEKLTTDLRVAPSGIEATHLLAVVRRFGSLTGAGTVDARNALDFKMVASLSTPQTAASIVPSTASSAFGSLLGKITGGGGCKSGLTVPFQVKGTTADPKFVPDVGGMAASMFSSKLGCL
jgi:AsmA protein